MIHRSLPFDFNEILTVVNDAAQVYKGIIPADRWKEPYMPAEELKKEISDGVEFYGFKDGILVGVMGIQRVRDVTLIRHAYVLRSHQRKGIGEKTNQPPQWIGKDLAVLVGTWEAAWWAEKFYEKNGFTLVTKGEKNRLLRKYWQIPERQVKTSVVLKLNK